MSVVDVLFLSTVVPVAALAALAKKKGRLWAGAWLLTLAPLYLPMGEDGFLALWYALATPALDPHGIRGVVHPHALGHVLGAGVSTIALAVLAAWIARRPLRRREAWAWNVLLALGTLAVATAAVELGLFYSHGLPPAAEPGEFGWPFWIAGIAAWVAGLWLARPERPSGG